MNNSMPSSAAVNRNIVQYALYVNFVLKKLIPCSIANKPSNIDNTRIIFKAIGEVNNSNKKAIIKR